MEFKNNVTRLLDSRRVPYTVHTFDSAHHSAVEVAEAIGLPAERVYKTLVALPEDAGRKPMLVIVPGPATLDLKQLAKAARLKKARMATHDQAEALTGLQTGGISALALINRGFEVYLDQQAQQYATIAVSAGQRGANLEVPVKDLVKLTNARVVAL